MRQHRSGTGYLPPGGRWRMLASIQRRRCDRTPMAPFWRGYGVSRDRHGAQPCSEGGEACGTTDAKIN